MTWLTLRKAAEQFGRKTITTKDGARKERLQKSHRALAQEVKDGRLRAAQIGGRGEWVTCQEWIDEYVEAQAQPMMVAPMRRRA